MSQPGYGYGVPQGHHPEPAYPSMPYPAYPQSSQYSNEPTDVTAQRHGDAAQQSYGYQRNMIPGLDLGFSASGTEQQSSWARPPPESWHPLPKPPSAGGQGLHQALATAGGSSKPSAAIADGSALDDESEEGEVSEG
ncbi:zinc finger domain-containing ccch-type, partial [Lasius niger]